jgi:hypothetical protein
MGAAVVSTIFGVYASMDNRLDQLEQQLVRMDMKIQQLESVKK